MKNVIGNHMTITLFGESHGVAIGAVIDGMPSGVKIDMDMIASMMEKRKAAGSISTARKEEDLPEFLSGVKDGYSEGTPIAFIIANNHVNSEDYNALENTPRPSHADYAGHVKYRGYEDARGGGHFSGRLTAPLVCAGAICMSMLREKGIEIGTHIASIGSIEDDAFDEKNLKDEIRVLNEKKFAVLNDIKGEEMIACIEEARMNLDSVGGILDTAVIGLPAGIGEPVFSSLESELAKAMFSIPALKGIEFGKGFGFANLYGSEANDPFVIENGEVVTLTNNNGGVNGGISNGMPLRFRTVIKPTPSIAKVQKTVDLRTMKNTEIEIHGRHDPAIIHRARVVVDALTAFVLCDLMMERYGSLYFGGDR